MEKLWKKPELIVLGRRNSDEMLFYDCKTGMYSDPIGFHNDCIYSTRTIYPDNDTVDVRCTTMCQYSSIIG
jgi:hypothetical protein